MCDYLAIQGLATLSEHAFSSGGIMGSSHRSFLTTEIFKALQILKSTYHNDHTLAATQAIQHLGALLLALDGGEFTGNDD